MTDDTIAKVYEIDVSGKYILAFDEFIPDEGLEYIRAEIKKWLEGDGVFMILRGMGDGVRLVKVESDDNRND